MFTLELGACWSISSQSVSGYQEVKSIFAKCRGESEGVPQMDRETNGNLLSDSILGGEVIQGNVDNPVAVKPWQKSDRLVKSRKVLNLFIQSTIKLLVYMVRKAMDWNDNQNMVVKTRTRKLYRGDEGQTS